MSDQPILGLVGHPVHYSRSPQIFSYLGKKLGFDLHYMLLDCDPEDFEPFFAENAVSGMFLGWNVTQPFKERALQLCDEATDAAEIVGATNIVSFTSRGPIAGNTDHLGFQFLLNQNKIGVADRNVLIFGAGGAARAVAKCLGSLGAHSVHVHSRTLSRSARLVNDFEKIFRKIEWKNIERPEKSKCKYDILIQCTSSIDAVPFPKELQESALGIELQYGNGEKPGEFESEFLKKCRALGLRNLDGVDMLVGQALEAWEIWFGYKVDPLSVLEPLRRIARG